MKKLLVVADDKIPFLHGAIEKFAAVHYLPGDKISHDDVKLADALITRTRTQCNAKLLENTNVQLVATATIGYDHIDTKWCEQNGIHWVNAPGCNSNSVKQYVTAAIVTVAQQRNLKLSQLTLGVVGVGNVGKKVAQAAQALGMHVVLNDPLREELEGSVQFTTLDQLLEVSDIVTLHTPLTKNNPYPTFHLANDTFFDKMKTGAVFINAARGEVTDSAALKKAIENKIADAIIDVWEGEPNNIDQTLIQQAFIATPHIAGYSADGKANGTAQCVHEIAKYFHINELENWYPTALPQPPMPATFHINCTGKSTQQIVYEAVTHTYPIMEDSRKLKENHKAFEMLRGKYWIRREFEHFKVILEGQQKKQQAANMLQTLGFQTAIL